jgi:hypothetical protein
VEDIQRPVTDYWCNRLWLLQNCSWAELAGKSVRKSLKIRLRNDSGSPEITFSVPFSTATPDSTN